MPKPNTIPTWATNPGATSDPGDARRATGFIAGRLLPAKWLNWLFAQQGGWFQYLRDLHLETEFLNKAYAWTGAHGFASSVGMFGPAVLGPSTELQYGNGAGIVTPKFRSVMVPTTCMWSEHVGNDERDLAWKRLRTRATTYGGTNTVASTGGFICMNTNRRLVAEFPIPTGATVAACQVGMTLPSSGYAVRMDIGVRLNGFADPLFTPIADNDSVEVHSTRDFALPQATGVLEHNLETAGQFPTGYGPDRTFGVMQIMLSILSGTGSYDAPTTLTAPYTLNWMVVRLHDPGPRNF